MSFCGTTCKNNPRSLERHAKTALVACRSTERHATRARNCMSPRGRSCKNGPIRMSFYRATREKSPEMHVVSWNDMQKRPCWHVVLQNDMRKEPENACRNGPGKEPENACPSVERPARTAQLARRPTGRHAKVAPVRMSFYGTTCETSPKMHAVR